MNAPPKKSSPIKWLFIVGGGCLLLTACLVVAGAVAVPAFISYTRKSKITEANLELLTLSAAVTSYCQTNGALPGAAGPVPPVPGSEKQVGDFGADPVFSVIGFAPYEPVYFSYAIEPDPYGDVMLVARGDLDGDGAQSRFSMQCSRSTCECAAQPPVDELE